MEISDENLKTLIIIIMVLLLFASILGINVLNQSIYWVQDSIASILKFIVVLMGSVGYDLGEIINASSNTVTNVAKTSIDVGNGAVNDMGSLLKGQQSNIDIALNHRNTTQHKEDDPKPSSPHESSDRWCYIGENVCAQAKDKGSCSSGKTYQSEKECLDKHDK